MYTNNKIDGLRFSLAIGRDRYSKFIGRMHNLGFPVPQNNDPISRLNFTISIDTIQKIEPTYINTVIAFKASGEMEKRVKGVLKELKSKEYQQNKKGLFGFFN